MSRKNPWKNLTEAKKEAIAKAFADAWLAVEWLEELRPKGDAKKGGAE